MLDLSRPGLGTQLRHLLDALDGDVQAIYAELGVPFKPRFFPVVQALMREAPLSVGQIAERIGVSQPAITQTLREMDRAGLIEMQPGIRDRRQREVMLSEAGTAICAKLAPVWQAIGAAGASLDAQLPHALGDLLAQALARLAADPFHDRIRKELK